MSNKSIIEKLIFPVYDEGAFLYISLTLLCLLFSNYEYFIEAAKLLLVRDRQAVMLFVLSIPYALIIIDALYNAFRKRRKTRLEITGLLLLTVFVNMHVNIFAIMYFNEHRLYPQIFFPAVNMIHVFWILFAFRYGTRDDAERILEYFVSDEELDMQQALIGTVTTLILFYVVYYYLKYDWSATLALCISYAVIFNRLVAALFKDIMSLIAWK